MTLREKGFGLAGMVAGLDPRMVRWVAVGVVFVLLYGSRLSRGVTKQTPEGMEFALKPMVIASQIGALLLYASFLAYTAHSSATRMPVWFYGVFVVAIGLILMRLPGTILLGAQAVTQSYWLLKQRVIGYGEVVSLQVAQGGRATRVIGDNRVMITHSGNHAASAEFRAEMERRTGKKVG